jgi:hypothetical protein
VSQTDTAVFKLWLASLIGHGILIVSNTGSSNPGSEQKTQNVS